MTFEYKVVPAPTRGRKAKGVKTPADRFARALEDVINDLATEGWEYLRTDTLPAEERQGLTGRTTVYQNMLVFRRAIETADKAEPGTVKKAAEKVVEKTVTTPPPPEPPKAPKAPVVHPAGERAPETAAPAPDTPAQARPETPQRAALKDLIERELAAAQAPKLPSAGAAQDMSPGRTGPVLTASRKDVAAE